jgi:ribulose-5-phosphate 4-epimerase/fuculose-1-phosphate aldolase
MKPSAETIEEFVGYCHQAAALGLVRCSSGNLSWRVDDEHVLLSGTKSWLSEIVPEQVAVVRLADGASVNDVSPSVESRFHLGILRNRTDQRCVLHFQSTAATTLACRPSPWADLNVILEMPYYVGPVATVGFHLPGSGELAEAVIAAAAEHDMVVMANHGQVAVGTCPRGAIQQAAFFELACEIVLRNGPNCRPIPDEHVRTLRSFATEGGPA